MSLYKELLHLKLLNYRTIKVNDSIIHFFKNILILEEKDIIF